MSNHATNASGQRTNAPRPPADRSYRAYHDPASAARASTTLVHALADAMGADVSLVERSLADVLDPEALDRLFAPGPTVPGHVAFCVDGYRVTVYSDGGIVVTPPTPRAAPHPA